MENNTTQVGLDWISQEEKELSQTAPKTYEELPGMKFQENKLEEVQVDISKKWETYTSNNDAGKPVTKAIIPVANAGVRKHWWVNKANPVYGKLIMKAKEAAAKGQTSMMLRILRTGQQNATRYALVE